MHRFLLVLALFTLSACGGSSAPATTDDDTPAAPLPTFSTFDAATLVIGQPDFASFLPNQGALPNGSGMDAPAATTLAGDTLFVCDFQNSRVLGYDAVPMANNAAASFVLGQPDLMSIDPNQGGPASATTMERPWGVGAAGGRLFVSDSANNRVLIYSSIPTVGVGADLCVGQASLTTTASGTGAAGLTSPLGIHVVGTKLIVCDFGNHRVLVWNTIPLVNGVAADLVIGQADFATVLSNRGSTPDANTLSLPYGVWSDGTKLAIADGGNHRVLVWNTFPTTNGQAADFVLGQANFTINLLATRANAMFAPTDVTGDADRLIVGDCENNRILIFQPFPTETGASASSVLGQGDFTHGTGNDDDQDDAMDAAPTARTMNTTSGYAFVSLFGTRLFSTDLRNNRVVIYEAETE